MENLHWAVASGATAVDLSFGLTTTPSPHYQRRKIDCVATTAQIVLLN